jgi:hypothetical protein
MLCKVCLSIDFTRANQADHHSSYFELVRAANNGCQLCDLIRQNTEANLNLTDELDAGSDTGIICCGAGGQGDHRGFAKIYFWQGDLELWGGGLSVYTYPGKPLCRLVYF